MAILLPQQFFALGPGIGKSFFEDLTGGTNATITVSNFAFLPVELVVTRVNAPVITYSIPGNNSLTLAVDLLLVAALLAPPGGIVTGSIQIATSDF